MVFCHCVDQYQRVIIYEIFLPFSKRLMFPFEVSSSCYFFLEATYAWKIRLM